MKKFNGWQRLWVVASVVALPMVGVVWEHDFGRDFPRAQSVREEAKHKAEWLVYVPVNRKQWDRCMEARLASAEGANADWNTNGDYCRAQQGYATDPDAEKAAKKVIANAEAYIKNDLLLDQIKALWVPLAAWVALISLVYLAGAAIAWIIRGFRAPKAST